MTRRIVALAAMATLAAVQAQAADSLPEVQAVRLTTIDYRPALRVLVSDDMPASRVTREGDDVLIRLDDRQPTIAFRSIRKVPCVQCPLQFWLVHNQGARIVCQTSRRSEAGGEDEGPG